MLATIIVMDTDQPDSRDAQPRQTGPRHTVGIRELKQNPSEIIARAANGERFDVLSNGKAVGVVIQRDATVRRRWVTSDAVTEMTRLADPNASHSADLAGWAREVQEARELAYDPIVDPWEPATSHTATQQAAEA